MLAYFTSLDDLFFTTGNQHFTGVGHHVLIDESRYQFVKGSLRWFSPRYQHPHMRSDSNQPAVYVAQEVYTGKAYVGSTSHPGTRRRDHQYAINHGIHGNPAIREMLENGEPCEFDYYAIFVETREQAFEFEQKLVNYFKEKGLVLNAILEDVRYPFLDASLRDQATVRIRHLGLASKREVMVEGVVYSSLKEAVARSGYSKLKIGRMIRNDQLTDTKWTGALPQNAGKGTSEEHRIKLKEIARRRTVHYGQIAAVEKVRKKIELNDIRYPSSAAVTAATGVSKDTITRLMRSQNATNTDGYIVINYARKRPDCTPKRVEIDGVTYSSMSDASRELGLDFNVIRKYKRTGRLKVIE